MHTTDQVVRSPEFSPAKQKKLEKILEKCEEMYSQKQKLQELCKTRWVECHDVLDRLIDLLQAVVDTIAVYSKLAKSRTPRAVDVSSLLHSICSFELIICLITVKNVCH